MSLKKKIVFSFLVSIFIITLLVTFEYINFVEIKKEIWSLELTGTIRSKSLQLRRHEKNFFLYPGMKGESEAVHQYLHDLNGILNDSRPGSRHDTLLLDLKRYVREYENNFTAIELSADSLTKEIEESRTKFSGYFPLIKSMMIESPIQGIAFLQKVFLLPQDDKVIKELGELDIRIKSLRKNGEDILGVSDELDKIARTNVEHTIYMSQLAILIILPLFLITGIGTIFFFNRDVVKRLNALTEVVERTGKGNFSKVVLPPAKWGGNDEVSVLITKFNTMEEQLAQREEELNQKNTELLQSKKLAAIGTLASGVAHELNNPLNNIYISTQVLVKEVNETTPSVTREIVADIRSQTLRLKKIVGALLEFARGREPHLIDVELNSLIRGAYKLVGNLANVERVQFVFESDPGGVIIQADPEQMERVFINLFSNAVEAMEGAGVLTVRIIREEGLIKIIVKDTGKGIKTRDLETVFEPFFSTKDKGVGLGLAIVFNTINKHKGNITVQSEEGKGSTFTITIPGGSDRDVFQDTDSRG
jgi:two-component system NtrC family sensor kinase